MLLLIPSRRLLLLALLAGLLAPLAANAHIIIVPVPPAPPPHAPHPIVPRPRPPRHEPPACILKSVTIDATVRGQVAEVSLSQVFVNPSSRALEAEYLFPVPPDAVISHFTLMADGKELPAKLYTREEANRIYESIVRARQDPALLQYMGYGLLKTSVFPVPANGERKVTLRYGQLCRRDRDLTELTLPLSAAGLSGRPVESLRVEVRLDGDEKVKGVFAPNYPADVSRPSDTSAVVRYATTRVTPADDFRLLWSLSDRPIGATLLTYRPDEREDGYFLLLASPEVRAAEARVASKTVVFVLDRSGSMAGKKIEQARNALKFVLNNLREGDTFNIITYDHGVYSFKPELQRFDEETRKEALRFVDSIHDGGSTNIDGALKRAFEVAGDTGKPTYVIFLTDGLPTAGEQNESRIAANASAANRHGARLFAFGVGFDVNARLIDRLTTDHGGVSEYVKPSEDIEAAVAKFYGRITAPVATAVRLDIPGSDLNRVYPEKLPDLFAGQQLVAVGRYRTAGPGKVRLTAKVGDAEQTIEYPANLVARSGDETYAFVEKLWATRRVGEIINLLDLHGKNQELLDELVRLSTRHGILTPYTAFLADERTVLSAAGENRRRAEEALFESKDGLAANTTGGAGVNLRAAKGQMQAQAYAPNSGRQKYADAAGNEVEAVNCQVVGNKAFFRRQDRWIDPTVTPEDERAAEVIEQFSPRFFELARTNANLRKYLALPDGCTVRVDGKVYQINAQQAPRG